MGLAAAEQVTWAEIPVMRILMGVRSAGRPAAAPGDPARYFVGFSTPGWAKMIANFRVSGGELSTDFPDDIVEQELTFTRAKLGDVPPGRTPFAPEQPAAQDAAPIDRLAACLGRKVTP